MLKSLHIVDLKGIHDLTVPIGGLTVFVGPNGIGKTTVLEAVELLGFWLRSPSWSPSPYFESGRWNRVAIIRGAMDGCCVDASFEASEVKLEVPRVGEPRLVLTLRDGHRFGFAGNGNVVPRFWTPLSGRPSLTEQEFIDVDQLAASHRLRLNVERIAAPAPVASDPEIAHDGLGLAAVLQYLHGLRDGSLEKIESDLRLIVPRFLRVQFRPVVISSQEIENLTVESQPITRVVTRRQSCVELQMDFDDAKAVPATHVSEGTLIALTILALVHGVKTHQQPLLLIEDIDRALHPSAQQQLVKALYAVLQITPGLQILATAHSPDFVDMCEASDVRVMGRGADGNVVARALSEHPEAAKWLKLLRVGEFWSSVGEDWVADVGAPST